MVTRFPVLATLTLAGALACTACSGSDSDQGESDSTLKHYRYVDVNPKDPLAGKAKTALEGGLADLANTAQNGRTKVQRALAAETLARIQAGEVRIGSIHGARGI